MRMARAAALLVLAVSLAGNAWLAGAGRHGPPSRQGVAEGAAAPARVVSPAGEAARAPASPAATTARGTAAQPSPELGQCQQRVSALQREVQGEAEALRPALPADRLFERGQPNREAQRLIEPVVTRLFAATGPGRRGPTVECRDIACKLVFSEPSTTADEAWDQALAGDAELRAWSVGAAMAQAAVREDRVTGQRYVERTVFFKLNGPKAVATLASGDPARGGR